MRGNFEKAFYESPTLSITNVTGEFSILNIKLPDGSTGEILINIESDEEDFIFEETLNLKMNF